MNQMSDTATIRKRLIASTSIPEAFFSIATECPNQTVYSQAVPMLGENSVTGKRSWKSTNYSEARRAVSLLAAHFLAIGVKPGDRVAIVSNTRPEWLIADLAVLTVGGVVVSVYQSLLAKDIGYILFDSGATVVVLENQEQLNKLRELQAADFAIPGHEDRPPRSVSIEIRAVVSFEAVKKQAGDPAIVEYGEVIGAADNPAEGGTVFSSSVLPSTVAAIKLEDTATLVYTSGTTGPPKGVVQTHRNHLANVRQALDAEIYRADSALMLFLPLAHSFAKLIGYIGFLTPAELRFVAVLDRESSRQNAAAVSSDIRAADADVVPVVPRLLEKMQEAIIGRSARPGLQAWVIRKTISESLAVYRGRLGGVEHPSPLWVGWLVQKTQVKLKRLLFGERLRYCVSGGAKLPVHVGEFFAALGIEILEGYGLTETCVATNVNRSGRGKLGTVGPALADDIEVRIADDGEILFRGPNVAVGYYQRPTATAASWDAAGWFHTGDLGALDEDKFLAIVGRKKELIVTAGGKKVAPENIEQKLKETGVISQAVLLGEGKPYCVAVVTLQQELVRQKLKINGPIDNTAIESGGAVHGFVVAVVKEVNRGLASFETIKKIIIAPEEFTVENGCLTPTFKVKRGEVAKRFAAEIEALYQRGGGGAD